MFGKQTEGVVCLGKCDSVFRTREHCRQFHHTDRRRGSRIARRERALLVRARTPAAAPLHAPAPVARESRSSVFAPVAPNANPRAPAKRSEERRVGKEGGSGWRGE